MDIFSQEKRSQIMRCVKSKNTSPEVLIRQYLHRQGMRFRLHVKSLPGNPDLFLRKYNAVIFYHGCFWHGHNCKSIPKSNVEFWEHKIHRNKNRDQINTQTLLKLGYRVLIIWGCSHTTKHRLNAMLLKACSWIKSASSYKELSREENNI